ncbi:2'-5' RNA ligase family protein [Nocardia macrotermitis]|uniref:2'-5' RNA ligase n=1 Tax=Nocardia macrotermitis TaxID=2585198 RepID=A0A7K0CX56_9NOCA|nr:2'-5' RNA ligase family protein [Nocardia macrotermitis]MQY18075.1 hypothetical protein [Nocardia macrotermitis]
MTTDDSYDRRPGILGHYWFLTFGHAPALHAMATAVQQTIPVTDFAPVPVTGLHLTLDRIARPEKCSAQQLDSIARAAQHACRDRTPFTVRIAGVTNLHGALAFTFESSNRIRELSGILRAATLSVYPAASFKDSHAAPHITIAYPIATDMSVDASSIADRMNEAIAEVGVVIAEAELVLLERHLHAYSWTTGSRIPLGSNINR